MGSGVDPKTPTFEDASKVALCSLTFLLVETAPELTGEMVKEQVPIERKLETNKVLSHISLFCLLISMFIDNFYQQYKIKYVYIE